MKGKYAYSLALEPGAAPAALEAVGKCVQAHLGQWRQDGLEWIRVYRECVEGHEYAFMFIAASAAKDEGAALLSGLAASGLLDGWQAARHVYEFKLHPGDSYDGLKTQGIIIGVREGKLEEYIRLHDEQPQIIHDLCYQNGFRKSSIFVADLHKQYLLQFQDFSGEENPALYENETYLEWLDVTGACQAPLPGEKFWKPMESVLEV